MGRHGASARGIGSENEKTEKHRDKLKEKLTRLEQEKKEIGKDRETEIIMRGSHKNKSAGRGR